jgi:hypothetical protein
MDSKSKTTKKQPGIQEAIIMIVGAGKIVSAEASKAFSDPDDTTITLYPLTEAARHLVAARHALQSMHSTLGYKPLPG